MQQRVQQASAASAVQYALRAAAFLSILTSCSIAIVLFQLVGCLILLVPTYQQQQQPTSSKQRKLYRRWMRTSQRLFGSLVLVLTYLFAPVDLVLYGDHDLLECSDFTVIMSNHQIYTDWWYIWILSWFKNAHGEIKIMLKDSLAKLPIFGWGMSFFEFIFMARKWSIDRQRIAASITRCMADEMPAWFLIFPEGTVITDDTKSKMRAYAQRNADTIKDQELPRFVLLPRSTGLYSMLSLMTQSKNNVEIATQSDADAPSSIQHIFDLTIAYDGIIADMCPFDTYPLDRVFFGGQGPRRVHIHVRRIFIADIPGISSNPNSENLSRRSPSPNGKETDSIDKHDQADPRFTAWLRSQFHRKDVMLDRFYETGSLDPKNGSGQNPRIISIGPQSIGWMQFAALVGASLFFESHPKPHDD